MAVIKIDLEAPKQEFEIGGKVFDVYYDDENVKKYEQMFRQMMKKYENYSKIDFTTLSEEEVIKASEDIKESMKIIIEAYFGENTFDFVYQAGGKSIYNMRTVVEVVMSTLSEKMESSKAEKAKNYIK